MQATEDNCTLSDQDPTQSDAFALVGQEIRAEILWVLWTTDREEFAMSFGEIRSHMTTDVDPSQLHYHLKQLVGNYIDRSDAGYHLRPEGIRLSLILRAGTLDLHQSNVRFEPDFECHICQSPVVGRFSYGCIEVLCKECGFWYGHEFLYLSPAAFMDESGSFSFSQFTEYLVQVTFSIGQDICFSCSHSLDSTVETDVDRFQYDHTVLVNKSCDQCGASWKIPLGRALLSDPGLVAFCYDHDIDILSTPHWELEFAAVAEHVRVRSTDPWEVVLDVTLDGDTLELVVDRDATVIERTRTDDSDDEHR